MALNDLFEKLTETVTDSKKRVTDFAEITKLNQEIGSIDKELEKLFCRLGRKYFADHCNESAPYDYSAEMERIAQHLREKQEIDCRIDEIKNGKICPQCGERIVEGVRFCGSCGYRVEATLMAEDGNNERKNVIFCPECGQPQSRSSVFCANCGARLRD